MTLGDCLGIVLNKLSLVVLAKSLEKTIIRLGECYLK